MSSAATQMNLNWQKGVFTIAPVQGDTSLIPGVRNWKIDLRGFCKDLTVTVNIPNARIQREENTTVIYVTAPVDQEITLSFTGENLLHDNAEALDRCFHILLYSQISTADKEHIWKCLQKEDELHEKIHQISAFRSRDISGVVGAIRELLTLTQEEYDT